MSIDVWTNHYGTLLQPIDARLSAEPLPHLILPAAYGMALPHRSFTSEKTAEAISVAANSKAPGIDRLITEHLKLSLSIAGISYIS